MYGAASRARTSDFKIFSLALSQLSYRGVIVPNVNTHYKVNGRAGRASFP